MKRMLLAGPYLAIALCLGGCSTLSGDFHQKLQIDALDARNRPVDGMRCQVGSGTSAKTVVTPATDVRVRRALTPLTIECRRDNLVATATVKSRRERMEEALLPFGSVAVFVDHMSGSLYSYPTTLHLRVGQNLVLEHGGEAQVAKAEAIPVAPRSEYAPTQRADLLAAEPAANAATARTTEAANPLQKTQAAPAPKSERAKSKPVKTTTAAAAKPKARTASSKLAVTAPTAATAAAAAAVHSAPANW